METRTYHNADYRIFQGHETRQIDGHTLEAAIDDDWYWEPADYEGDVLFSGCYADADEAALGAEDGHDAGDWS